MTEGEKTYPKKQYLSLRLLLRKIHLPRQREARKLCLDIYAIPRFARNDIVCALHKTEVCHPEAKSRRIA